MSLLRQGRFLALVLVVLISVMAAWNPLAGLKPEASGVNLGVDFAGGARAFFSAEASQVTINVSGNDLSSAWGRIQTVLGRDFEVSLVSQNQENNQLVVSVGGIVSQVYVQNRIGSLGNVVDVKTGTAPAVIDSLISAVKLRVDPYGVLGVRARSWGTDGLVVESPLSLPTEMITTQGRFELIVDGQVIATNSDISRIGLPTLSNQLAALPIYFYSDSSENINQDIKTKEDEVLSLYVDRPSDAVIIFDNDFLSGLSAFAYDENSQAFLETALNNIIQVPALMSSMQDLSSGVEDYLVNNASGKLRVIVLTPSGQYSSEFENDIPSSYKIELAHRLQDETGDLWLTRVCGLISVRKISANMAENGISNGLVLAVAGTAETGALDLAKTLRVAAFDKLPAKVSFVYEFSVEASYSPDFLKRVAVAYVIGLVAIFLIAHRRYKIFGVSAGILGITLCELLISLGAVAITRISFGFAELAGVLLVTVMGVSHLIIITDEMLGEAPKDKKVRIGWRAPQALGVARFAAVLAIGAAFVLGWFGPDILHGFAVVVVGTTLISVLLTRSLYARLIDSVVSKGSGAK
jgi:preprotein translocase subunit SecD